MLDERQIDLIDRKLNHLHDEHVDDLLSIANRVVNKIEPSRKEKIESSTNATISNSLRAIPQETLAALSRYGDNIIREVTSTISGLNIDLDENDKRVITTVVKKYLEESLYEKRFQSSLNSIHRHLGRYGTSADLQRYGLDIQKSSHDIGVKNIIRRNIAKLQNDLDVFILRKHYQIKTESESEESKLDKANKAIKLEPNFFGFGLNLNYLINRWIRRKK